MLIHQNVQKRELRMQSEQLIIERITMKNIFQNPLLKIANHVLPYLIKSGHKKLHYNW